MEPEVHPTLSSWLENRQALYRSLANGESATRDNVYIALGALQTALRIGKKILIMGNGGSAAEAQHFAAELVGRFRMNRRALPALALTTDTSIITAWANDAGFDTIFSRQIEAFGNRGDAVVCFTTSDCDETHPHSMNLFYALSVAKKRGMATICFGSSSTEKLASLADITVRVPSQDGAIVQEVHLVLIHYLCAEIEKTVCS